MNNWRLKDVDVRNREDASTLTDSSLHPVLVHLTDDDHHLALDERQFYRRLSHKIKLDPAFALARFPVRQLNSIVRDDLINTKIQIKFD